MKFEQWQRAVQAKVSSSVNLHTHLPNLSFFVMLSSIVGMAGHVSQANYAAGNTFQDALARHRAASGLPGVSLDFGVVKSVGYVEAAAEGPSAQARIEALGAISPDISLIMGIIEDAVLRNPQRSRPEDAQVIVGLAPWDRLPDGSVIQQDRRFGTLRLACPRGDAAAISTVVGGGAAASPTGMLVRALATLTERARSVAEAVAARLAVIFSVSSEEVDLDAPMAKQGVDSLVAVELRNWLSGVAKAKLSVFEILQSTSVMEFAGLIIERSQVIKEL
jgi:hypothetical protein